MTTIPATAIVPDQRSGETVEVGETADPYAALDLALVQAEAITAREAGFSQVPICRDGQWGVLRRTPRSEDFIPTRSLRHAIAIVTSPVVC